MIGSISMNILKSKLFLVGLLSINLTQTPLQAKPALIDTLTSKVIGGAATYCIISYLIQENYLVKDTFPIAQAWYDAMAFKYPKAHLD